MGTHGDPCHPWGPREYFVSPPGGDRLLLFDHPHCFTKEITFSNNTNGGMNSPVAVAASCNMTCIGGGYEKTATVIMAGP